MSYKVEFHAQVYEDYQEAYLWYESKRVGLGDRFLAAFREKIQQIEITPEIYSEKSRKGYREAKLNAFPYSIIYKIYKYRRIIFVNSLHHEKRHPYKKYRK